MTVDQLTFVIFLIAVACFAVAIAAALRRRWFEAGVLVVSAAIAALVVLGPNT